MENRKTFIFKQFFIHLLIKENDNKAHLLLKKI